MHAIVAKTPTPLPGTTALRRAALGSLYLLLLFIAAVPIFSVRLPPLYDYPNHLARIYILENLASSELLQRYYEANWSILPNLGAEMILMPLAYFADVLTAGKIGIFVIVATQTAACSLLSYAYHRKVTVLPFVSFFFVYSVVLQFGFIGYLFGVGLAIASFASWILLRDIALWRRTLLFGAIGVVLFFVHLYAVGLFGMCAGAYEVGRWVRARHLREPYRASHFVPLVVCGVISVCLLAASATGGKYGSTTWPPYLAPWHYLSRVEMLADTMPSADRYGSDDHHIGFAITCSLYLAGLLTGRLRIAPQALAPLLALAIALFAMPSALFSSWAADLRLAMVLTFVFAASVRLAKPGRYGTALVATLIVVVVSIRAEQFTTTWRRHDAVYDQYIKAISRLPSGARLTAAIGYDGEAEVMRHPSLNHVGSLVVIFRQGFYPTIFANAGQQPLRLRPAYAALQQRYRDPSFRGEQLLAPYLTTQRNPFDPDLLAQYDYLLLTREALFATKAPGNLTDVFVGPDFRLARIERSGPAVGPPVGSLDNAGRQ